MSKEEKDSLGNRMKSYEYQSTCRNLISGLPVYARIDGRAFHTLCRGMKKPYSTDFMDVMKSVCSNLVSETGAILGYVESDEISLGWNDISKAPFEGRIQKLESVLASLASSYFMMSAFDKFTDAKPEIYYKTRKLGLSFDCRVFNLPSMTELANAFLWRENDAIKNSITGMALNFYSTKQLDKVSGDKKIEMMKKEHGYDFYHDTDESFMRGTFMKRALYKKEVFIDNGSKFKYKDIIKENGKIYVLRSRIEPMHIRYRLTDIQNKEDVLFNCAEPVLNKENPTFDIGE